MIYASTTVDSGEFLRDCRFQLWAMSIEFVHDDHPQWFVRCTRSVEDWFADCCLLLKRPGCYPMGLRRVPAVSGVYEFAGKEKRRDEGVDGRR